MTDDVAPGRWELADAVGFATAVHKSQRDKAGQPYIGHPLRVMARVDGLHEQMAAVLHDVIEDCDVSAEQLTSWGCPSDVVAAVVALSKVPGESLEESIARVRADPLARTVKLADIADNADDARLALLPEDVAERLRGKYRRSRELLGLTEKAQGAHMRGEAP